MNIKKLMKALAILAKYDDNAVVKSGVDEAFDPFVYISVCPDCVEQEDIDLLAQLEIYVENGEFYFYAD